MKHLGTCLFMLTFGIAASAQATKVTTTLNNPYIPNSSEHVVGLYGSYSNFIAQDEAYYFFSNKGLAGEPDRASCPGAICPGLVFFQGRSLTEVGGPVVVFPNSLITDVKNPTGNSDFDPMIGRPTVKYSDLDQRYYAIVHVSAGYLPAPYNNRVYPAMLRSEPKDPTKWTYLKQINIQDYAKSKPTSKGPWCSGQTFLINDHPSKNTDHLNPMNNRFVIFEDCIDGGKSAGLKILYTNSSDGVNAKWNIFRENGRHILLQPKKLQTVKNGIQTGETWIFPSAVKTRNGYYMSVTGDWSKNHGRHRLLFSATGYSNWAPVGIPDKATGEVLWEEFVGGQVHPKNVNLSYDSEKNLLYFLISNSGSGGEKSIVAITPPK